MGVIGKKTGGCIPANFEGWEAMGESSVVIVKMPSNLRSGKGWVTSAETWARTLKGVSMLVERNKGGSGTWSCLGGHLQHHTRPQMRSGDCGRH